ncbi:MAG: hypothetical protein Tsb0020_04510 [Haliangiales bacterium]
MDRMIEILDDLSCDPFRRDAFLRAPRAVMAEAGLSPTEQAILMDGDHAALDRRLGGGQWARCAACVDPGPDPLD